MDNIHKGYAYELACLHGINFAKDSHEQHTSNMVYLSHLAKLAGYRKPKNANGSTARYFFNYLKRKFHK